MDTSAGPITAYRRFWLPELLVLVALALGTTVLFAFTGLDIAAQRPFYHPEFIDPWPDANRALWSLFFRSAPWVTGSLAVAGVVLIVAGLLRESTARLRLYGFFILLCVILGPGLIINVALKDHWGRPRPRQIVEFGGRLPYVQPLIPTSAYGKSFPCGHCSVGYLYAGGWWLWRRRHPRRAVMSLIAGSAFGTLLGVGRMAGGAHFLSDAIWSALIAYGVAHALYYYVLRVPAREDSRQELYPLLERSPRLKTTAIAASVLIGIGIIGGGILANPTDKDLASRLRLADFPAPPETIEVLVDTLDVELRLVTEPRDEIDSSGAIHGFGLPTNKIEAAWEFEGQPVPLLRYRVVMMGLFTDIDGMVRIQIPVHGLQKIIVRAKRGDISVIDATGAVPAGWLPVLDLRTASGRVQKP